MSNDRTLRGEVPLKWTCSHATTEQVLQHLLECDSDYCPPLSSRVNLHDYACKIVSQAKTYEAWEQGRLAGLVAAYFPEAAGTSVFISNVSVLAEFRRKSLAKMLLNNCIVDALKEGFHEIKLEVDLGNAAALRMYQSLGFRCVEEASSGGLLMRKVLV